MKPFSIPVVALGPGSQPGAEALDYLVLPSDMHTYRPPSLPEPEEIAGLSSARAVLDALHRGLAGYRAEQGGEPPMCDLTHLDPANLRLVNRVLGEGEVSAQVQLGEERVLIQESVFAGVWRVSYFGSAGQLLCERVEIGAVPEVIRVAADRGGIGELASPPETPGLMSAPALLAEIASRLAEGVAEHVINLSLLPYAPEDGAWLDAALGRGGVSLLSRGYGNCRITATGVARVWWVQYFNSMDSLILNTLEITAVPAVAMAAQEDIRDSAARLAEVLDWIG